ncbi:MAG: hypothetical protein PVJ01_05025 [Pseudomonadota bacterium]|jgi:hypothetical protein
MKIRMLIISGLIIAATGACAPTFNVTLGTMPANDPSSSIQAGVTTKADILRLFGDPDFTGVDTDGLEKWTWTHMDVKATPGKEAAITSFFNLEVSFDGEKVDSYSWSRKAE